MERTNLHKPDLKVQYIDSTNAKLATSQSFLSGQLPIDELCTLLNVGAVIASKYYLERSQRQSIGHMPGIIFLEKGALEKFLGIRSRVIDTSAFDHLVKADVFISLLDKGSNQVIWKSGYENDQCYYYGENSDLIVYDLLNGANREMPYFKQD